MPTVLFVGGGTVGHIAPALAVREALLQLCPDAATHVVCSRRGEDERFLREAGVPFTAIGAPRLSLLYLFRLIAALRQAARIIDAVQPDVILSKGGYVSVPVCIVARMRNIPVVLHESDAVGGYANRLIARWAAAVCTGFPTQSARHVFTGNPVRPDMTQGNKEEGLRITGCTADRPALLVAGGSQGSQALNEWVTTNLDALLPHCNVIHITGRGKRTTCEAPGYWQQEFVTGALPHLYTMTDLAVSRAGAGTIGELAANGIPAILVPLRGVGHDHQQSNALAAEASGGCRVVQQDAMERDLLPRILSMLKNPEERAAMSQQIRRLHHPDAARQIAKSVLQLLDEKTMDA